MPDEINDRIVPSTAARLLSGGKPYACCPRDKEPLVMTMERAGAEFNCVVCGGWFGFLSPTPKDPTPELQTRYAELKARFDAGERGPTSG